MEEKELAMTYKEMKEKMEELEKLRKEFASKKVEQLNNILNELLDIGIGVHDPENPDFTIVGIYYDGPNKKFYCEFDS